MKPSTRPLRDWVHLGWFRMPSTGVWHAVGVSPHLKSKVRLACENTPKAPCGLGPPVFSSLPPRTEPCSKCMKRPGAHHKEKS